MMKILKYLFWGLPFAPSFISAQGILNDNHYVKLLGFIIIFLFMLVLALIKRNIFTNNHIRYSLIDGCILVLLALHLYFSWGTYNILDHYYPVFYILFYFFLRLSINKDDYWEILTNISLIVISIHLVICGLQCLSLLSNYSSYFNVGSTFGNPDMLAAYLAVLFPICYKGRNLKIIRYSVSLLTILLFFFLQARTAIVATAVFLFWDLHVNKSLTNRYLPTGIFILMIGFICLAYWQIDSFSGRILIWIVSVSMIISKPMGWGVYAFEKHYPEFLSRFISDSPKIANLLNIDIVHSSYNEFFNIGVRLGVIGLVLYIWLTYYVIKTAYQSKSLLLYPIVVFQIISLSYFPFQIIPLAIVYILICILIISNKETSNVVKKKVQVSIFYIFIVCLSSYTVCCSYSFIQWKHAISNFDKIGYQKSFEKPYVFLKGNGRYLASYAEFCYKSNDKGKAFELMKEAEKYYSDIAFLNNLAVLYEENGFIIEAKERYDLATTIAPSNANIALAKLQFLVRIGDQDAAYKMALLWKEKLTSKNMRQKYKLASKKIDAIIIDCEK